MNKEMYYIAPQIEVHEIAVEQGFAVSNPAYNGFDPTEEEI